MPGDKLQKGPWYEEEDEQLTAVISVMGDKRWDSIAKASGLRRSGKSCRLRWMNYLRPNLKRGRLSAEEEKIVIQLHQQLGNKWSKIARKLPGRTDNEIKNNWRSHLRKKALAQGQDHGNVVNNPKKEKYDGSIWTADKSVDGKNGIVNDDIFRTKDYFAFGSQFSGNEIVKSPYANQLSDWLFEKSELNNLWVNLDMDFSYPKWNMKNIDYTYGSHQDFKFPMDRSNLLTLISTDQIF